VTELRTITRHAGTVLVGQLAVMAFGVTDTIVAGRYSQQALAALSVGSAVYITVFVGLMGVLQALLPTWAELHGGERHEALGRSVRQALYLCGLGAFVGAIALTFPGPLLDWTEVPESLQSDVASYLGVLTFALPAALLFRMYSTLNQSLGKPLLITWLQAGGLVIKVPLTIWFTFGGLGVPALGVVGCALGTVVVNYLLLACSVWLLRTDPLYRPYAIWKRIEPPDWHTIGQFARIGIPGGLAVTVEVTSFTLMSLFIARQGTQAAAAHQITGNLGAVMYMVPLSIAIATSARASYWLGARQPSLARKAIRTGFRIAIMMAVGMAAALAFARPGLAAIYTTDPAVAATAVGLLTWLAIYHVGDAIQVLCVFVLRCYRVAIAPLVAYCLMLWGVGLVGGYVLAYENVGPWQAQQSPGAFWAAATVALLLVAVIMLLILWRAVRSYRPAAA
jgi:multidrug resistance protein, MATE family